MYEVNNSKFDRDFAELAFVKMDKKRFTSVTYFDEAGNPIGDSDSQDHALYGLGMASDETMRKVKEAEAAARKSKEKYNSFYGSKLPAKSSANRLRSRIIKNGKQAKGGGTNKRATSCVHISWTGPERGDRKRDRKRDGKLASETAIPTTETGVCSCKSDEVPPLSYDVTVRCTGYERGKVKPADAPLLSVLSSFRIDESSLPDLRFLVGGAPVAIGVGYLDRGIGEFVPSGFNLEILHGGGLCGGAGGMSSADPSIHSVFSFKGGVGKTTITANLAATLSAQGWRVLLVDGDPQANLTGFMTRYGKQEGLEAKDFMNEGDDYVPQNLEESMAPSNAPLKSWWSEGRPGLLAPKNTVQAAMSVGGLFEEEKSLDTADFLKKVKEHNTDFSNLRRPTLLNGYRKLGLVKGTPHIVDWEKVANIEQQSPSELGRLRSGLLELGKGFDIVLIDLPPSISDMNKLFLTSSDYILMPVACDSYSADTLFQMFKGDKESVLQKMMAYMRRGSTMQEGINKKLLGGVEDQQTGDLIPVFERNIGIYPILMNMCQKARAYQSMGRIPTMWFNGYERFLDSATLPAGFKWVDESCRVVGAFNQSAAMANLQVRRLPVILSSSLALAEVTLRDSFLALSSMIVTTVGDKLEQTNPDLMRICKERPKDKHGHRATPASGCLGQVPYFRKTADHLAAELPSTVGRTELDETLIGLVESMVYGSQTHTQAIPRGSSNLKELTLRELLCEHSIEEKDITEHMGAVCPTVNGFKLEYVNGNIHAGAGVDFVLSQNDQKVAKVEAKAIDASLSRDKDFGLRRLTSQMTMVANVDQSVRANYGMVIEKNNADRGPFREVKQIALYKWVTAERLKNIYGMDCNLPAGPVLFCFIPVWRPSSRPNGEYPQTASGPRKRSREVADAQLDWLEHLQLEHLQRICGEKDLDRSGTAMDLANRLRADRGLSKDQLESICEVVGVSKTGNKADIIRRIGSKLKVP